MRRVLNLYSSRHYQTDEALYANFTKQTGIKINRIEGGEDPLIERIKNEGENSPADVLITVDAGRLWRAEQVGLFQPVNRRCWSRASRQPARPRRPLVRLLDPRARHRLQQGQGQAGRDHHYEDLADPKLKGNVCMRSGGHVYNLSLIGSLIDHLGEAKAEAWAKGVRDNLARAPKGGDTDQLKGVAAGECDVTISNTYYYARLLRSEKPDEKEIVREGRRRFPEPVERGTHVNISGAGVVKHAPHRRPRSSSWNIWRATKRSATSPMATTNGRWCRVSRATIRAEALGKFKADPLNVAVLGKNQPTRAEDLGPRRVK